MPLSRRQLLAAGTAASILAVSAARGEDTSAGGPTGPVYDDVIVGAGSAGAVLATRLSADANRRVLLLEAGPNFAPDAYPTVLANADVVAGSRDFDWNYHTSDGSGGSHDIAVPRGRVVGGSSAVNAAVAMRARPADFARWTRTGLDTWSWSDVLPVFKALENAPWGDAGLHGRSGPFPIRQRTAAENTVSMRAFVAAANAAGLPLVDDFNGAEQHGAGPYPLNVVDGVRVNTGMAYLTAAVRARPNLTIRADAEVDTVIIAQGRATGIRLTSGEIVTAGQVILSAGTFGSPAILLRSGVGPAAHLAELGIPVAADLPVGNRLKDHPFFYNVYALKPDAIDMTPAAGAIVWTRSSLAQPDELDLHLSATHLIDPKASPTGGAIVLAAAVTLPNSLGTFRLKSRDPRDMPDIRYNFFTDPTDLDRLVEAVRLSRTIAGTAPLADLIDHEMAPGAAVGDDQLRANIAANAATYLHPTSTVPMGGDADSDAVVDGQGRVRGIAGLRVIDASIMPDIPSVATNVTTIMLAEHIAARLTA